jgi:uncharacterized alpha-E superfamily protein
MARYTERAENLARMLDVNGRMSLMRRDADAVRSRWRSTLATVGQLDAYLAQHAEVEEDQAIAWVCFAPSNTGSILECLRLARENAHAVRGTLTTEAWETLNDTWLEARRLPGSARVARAAGDFFEWVKFRSHLARGVIQGTMLQDDALEFTWLGTYLERADNTARILDARFELLAPEAAHSDEFVDFYEWGALLRSVSAFAIYRKVYRDLITPRRVAELLILNESMPRSLLHCMREVHETLATVANGRSAETLRRAGEIHAGLQYGQIDEALAVGLHAYLSRFLERTGDLGARIAQDFLVSEAAS